MDEKYIRIWIEKIQNMIRSGERKTEIYDELRRLHGSTLIHIMDDVKSQLSSVLASYQNHIDFGDGSEDLFINLLDEAAKRYDRYIDRMKVTGSDAKPVS